MTQLRLTLTEVAGSIERQHGRRTPIWKLRRVVDYLESADSLDVQRVGNYRTIADGDVPIVAAELRRLGWLESEAVPC
jgi:hypothetical protein